MKLFRCCLALALMSGCTAPAPTTATLSASSLTPAGGAMAQPPDAGVKAASSPNTCGSLTLSFGATVPADFTLSNQTDADCFAWQEFIALNWPASGSTFGAPGDLSAVQWQGYMDDHQLFQPDAGTPPPWGTPPQISAACQAEAHLTDAQARAVHPLVDATAFSSQTLDASGTAEAYPFNAPAWLGDVNGNNVWYEVRIDQDEYNFVVQNQFYDAEKQLAFYTNQKPAPTIPLQLPAGCNATDAGACPRTTVGAIELKAAWMEVPDPTSARWNSYKLSSAVIVDPSTQKCKAVTVALVAFHILHKTQSQPTWVWATFEQKMNAPNAGADAGAEAWNFNGSCAARKVTVPAACQYDAGVVTTSCTPDTPPLYYLGDGCPAPTTTPVTRVTPLDATATSVNGTVQAAIQGASNGSVWQNYMLVNVVWSNNPPQIPPACSTPGSQGCQALTGSQITPGLNPSGAAVANSVLETYIQNKSPSNPLAKSNCVLCHDGATVPGNNPNNYLSDFSFALGEATSPASSPQAKAPKTTRPRQGARKIRSIFR